MAPFFKVKVGDEVYELDKLTLGEARRLKRDFGLTDLEAFNGTDPDQMVGLLFLSYKRSHPQLADDAILDEQGMLRVLEQDAGDWNVAYANDKHWGERLPTMPCIGGDLARAVGYLAPPGVIHWAIDNAWGEIGQKLNCLRYRADQTYTHLNPVWGTAPDDSTYRWARNLSPEWERVYRGWQVNELPKVLDRVRAAQLVTA